MYAVRITTDFSSGTMMKYACPYLWKLDFLFFFFIFIVILLVFIY